jgi:hypothetical protein
MTNDKWKMERILKVNATLHRERHLVYVRASHSRGGCSWREPGLCKKSFWRNRLYDTPHWSKDQFTRGEKYAANVRNWKLFAFEFKSANHCDRSLTQLNSCLSNYLAGYRISSLAVSTTSLPNPASRSFVMVGA